MCGVALETNYTLVQQPPANIQRTSMVLRFVRWLLVFVSCRRVGASTKMQRHGWHHQPFTSALSCTRLQIAAVSAKFQECEGCVLSVSAD